MGPLSRLGISSAAAVPSSALRRFAAGSTRRYGSAAAAVQYDSEYEEDYYYSNRMEPGRDAAAAEGTTTWGRGVQWALIGDPGARKHVYAEKLSKLLEVPHISMGTLLRQELNPNFSLYKQIANAVNDGKLVPEDVIFGLLSRRLEEGYSRGEYGFILDGIPRTRLQAEILDQIADIDLVVNFKCKENTDCLVKRTFYSVEKPKYEVADAGSMWNEKFRVYAEQGKALEDYYRKQRKLVDFQVAGAPGETWKGLLAALRLQHRCSSLFTETGGLIHFLPSELVAAKVFVYMEA